MSRRSESADLVAIAKISPPACAAPSRSDFFYCDPIRDRLLWPPNRSSMPKTDIWQGTLALMILQTIDAMGPQHGYGIARRIEQTSGDALSVNYGTIYPALLKLEQEGY